MDDSPAYQLLALIWDHHDRGHHKSWVRLNQCMMQALLLAIKSNMLFDLKDFARFAKEFRSRFWIDDERAYTLACDNKRQSVVPNRSAAMAFERWAKRKPFRWKGTRLAIGSPLFWEGKHLFVTSINDADGHLIACAYRYTEESPPKRRIAKRVTITHAHLKAAKALKDC